MFERLAVRRASGICQTPRSSSAWPSNGDLNICVLGEGWHVGSHHVAPSKANAGTGSTSDRISCLDVGSRAAGPSREIGGWRADGALLAIAPPSSASLPCVANLRILRRTACEPSEGSPPICQAGTAPCKTTLRLRTSSVTRCAVTFQILLMLAISADLASTYPPATAIT